MSLRCLVFLSSKTTFQKLLCSHGSQKCQGRLILEKAKSGHCAKRNFSSSLDDNPPKSSKSSENQPKSLPSSDNSSPNPSSPVRITETYIRPVDPFYAPDEPPSSPPQPQGSPINLGSGDPARPFHSPQDVTFSSTLEQIDSDDGNLDLTAPTNCCRSGCVNCVWVEYVERLTQRYLNPELGRERILAELDTLEDQSIKAFIKLELRSRGLL